MAGGQVGEELVAPPDKQGCHAHRRPDGRSWGLVWAPHWRIEVGGRSLCVRCGVGPLKCSRRRLGDWPCPGFRRLRAAAVVALRGGVFAEALGRAPELWRHKAAADIAACA